MGNGACLRNLQLIKISLQGLRMWSLVSTIKNTSTILIATPQRVFPHISCISAIATSMRRPLKARKQFPTVNAKFRWDHVTWKQTVARRREIVHIRGSARQLHSVEVDQSARKVTWSFLIRTGVTDSYKNSHYRVRFTILITQKGINTEENFNADDR